MLQVEVVEAVRLRSNVAPSTPVAGDRWYNTDTGVTSTYINDGNSSQWVQSAPTASPPAANGFASIAVQTFAISGTYTPTVGMKYCQIECIGGGGGGGGVGDSTSSSIGMGGGGSGGYSRKTVAAAAIGASQVVTIGAAGVAGTGAGANGGNGGVTSVGGICVANGGGGASGYFWGLSGWCGCEYVWCNWRHFGCRRSRGQGNTGGVSDGVSLGWRFQLFGGGGRGPGWAAGVSTVGAVGTNYGSGVVGLWKQYRHDSGWWCWLCWLRGHYGVFLMAIDFPFPATLGQLYVFNGVTYKFSAQNVWEVVGSVSAILSVNVQVFSVAGAFTYTPIAGMKYCVIECVGGGGGGGGTSPGISALVMGGGGGGSGGYSKKTVLAATIGASKTGTVGAGGAAGTAAGGAGGNGGVSALTGICSANGGFGGLSPLVGGSAGNGANLNSTIGDIMAGGTPGQNGGSNTTAYSLSAGPGGSSVFGGGGNAPPWGANSAVGGPGQAYGGGGAGGFCYDANVQRAGGAGAPGVVIVTEYL